MTTPSLRRALQRTSLLASGSSLCALERPRSSTSSIPVSVTLDIQTSRSNRVSGQNRVRGIAKRLTDKEDVRKVDSGYHPVAADKKVGNQGEAPSEKLEDQVKASDAIDSPTERVADRYGEFLDLVAETPGITVGEASRRRRGTRAARDEGRALGNSAPRGHDHADGAAARRSSSRSPDGNRIH